MVVAKGLRFGKNQRIWMRQILSKLPVDSHVRLQRSRDRLMVYAPIPIRWHHEQTTSCWLDSSLKDPNSFVKLNQLKQSMK